MIDHGHRLPDILDYTLEQLRGFLAAAERSEAANDARLLSLITLGACGDVRQIDKTLDKLADRAKQS